MFYCETLTYIQQLQDAGATAHVDVYPIEPMEYREFGIAVQNTQMMAPAVRQMAAHIEAYAAQRRAEDPQANAGFDPERHFL